MMCRAFVASIVSIGEYRKEDDRDMDCGIEVEENDSGTYVDYLYGTMIKERLDVRYRMRN